MLSVPTNYFGTISYAPGAALDFPRGLPGFEERRRFLALSFEDRQPLVFLQSLEDPGLCFITLPVLAIDPQYRLAVAHEDRQLIGLAAGKPLRIGEDVACLAVLSIRESGPTANLLAPVVINLRTQQAVQAVAAESGYSHRHVLVPDEAAVCS
jgi:flagellar assembly factor FliW